MIALATTLVDVYRDDDATDTDAWGDDVETGETTPVASSVPFSLVEQPMKRINAATGFRTGLQEGDQRETRRFLGRAGGERDIRRGDIVQDQRDGIRYAVTQVESPRSLIMLLDLRIELTVVT